MASVIEKVLDGLKTGKTGVQAFKELTDNDAVDPGFKPFAENLVELLADFQVKEPWLTDEVLVEGLELLDEFLRSKKPQENDNTVEQPE